MKIIQIQLMFLLLQFILIGIINYFSQDSVVIGLFTIVTIMFQFLYCIMAAIYAKEDKISGKEVSKQYIISSILIIIIGFPGCAIILF